MFGVLYVPTGYAMQTLLAAVVATTPVTVPGAYHYYKTERAHKMLLNDQADAVHDHDTFRPFASGVARGIVPPDNLICAFMYGPSFLFADLGRWENHEQMKLADARERARVAGFIAGFSLYATVPLALRYVRR